MEGRCIAYRPDGRLCGQPGRILDERLEGMVCAEHSEGYGETCDAIGGCGQRISSWNAPGHRVRNILVGTVVFGWLCDSCLRRERAAAYRGAVIHQAED